MPGPKRWRHRFREQVCRWTMPREAILDLLSRTSKHMSPKEIYGEIQKSYPGIGLTTVYRTLDLLVRSGVINRFSFGDGQSRYEFKEGRKQSQHYHLICTQCGRIFDYSDFVEEELAIVRKTEAILAKKYNFMVQDHNIEFYGLCDQCQSQNERRS
ncbi:MAG: transcriptional repressor [Candidatus Aminicenantes bacterium]|nr:transcriptional repressor [Candidatus Aminicenantes bacterium]